MFKNIGLKKLLIFALISIFFFFSIFFTNYAPDAYIFVKYALLDNANKSLSVESLSSNNFIFDLLSLLGYGLNLTWALDFLIFYSIFLYTLFFFKYIFILNKTNIYNTLLIFASSFFTFDLNIFRFHLAILFLILALLNRSFLLKYTFLFLSLVSHLFPLIFLSIKRFYFIPIIFIPFLVLYVSDSRLLLYNDGSGFVFFKSLILSIPAFSCMMEIWKKRNTNISGYVFLSIYLEITISFFIIGLILIFFNTVIASRLFESIFYLSTLAVLFFRYSKFNLALLYIFSILLFFSRYINGISSSNIDPQDFLNNTF